MGGEEEEREEEGERRGKERERRRERGKEMDGQERGGRGSEGKGGKDAPQFVKQASTQTLRVQ